ncbi:MAG: chlorophyll synthesis pathway protein BchC [Pseudomonadota bacterium]
METTAVILEEPGRLTLGRLPLDPAGQGDLLVETVFSGISTGTEKLLVTGQMPPFPGLGYPLVPGYESVGRVLEGAGEFAEGDKVFIPGARCYGAVRGLFGATASHIVLPADRAVRLPKSVGEEGVLIALAATAYHALFDRGALALPDLIIGHGVLGRLVARIAVALGGKPVVHEIEAARHSGALGYTVAMPEHDEGRYNRILDASGADGILDTVIPRLNRGGEIVLAGFYAQPVAFAFPPAFVREARLRIAAEFTPEDLTAVTALVAEGRLSLAGLVTHTMPSANAPAAYGTAFQDAACLKMIIDWRKPA